MEILLMRTGESSQRNGNWKSASGEHIQFNDWVFLNFTSNRKCHSEKMLFKVVWLQGLQSQGCGFESYQAKRWLSKQCVLFYMHYATHGTYGFTSHSTYEAITVTCLASSWLGLEPLLIRTPVRWTTSSLVNGPIGTSSLTTDGPLSTILNDLSSSLFSGTNLFLCVEKQMQLVSCPYTGTQVSRPGLELHSNQQLGRSMHRNARPLLLMHDLMQS